MWNTSSSPIDTIFAPCTGGVSLSEEGSSVFSYQQPSSVSVIRVSGPHALDVMSRMVGPKAVPTSSSCSPSSSSSLGWQTHRMYVRSLYHPSLSDASGERNACTTKENNNNDTPLQVLLDHQAMVVHFKQPHSFTGEDVVEFHVHGGRGVVQGVLDALMSFGNHVRPAEPGEFTKRAFQNGKMDLTQIEGLGDLLSSQTAAQRDVALASATGLGKEIVRRWRKSLITCIASIEAVIDFGEDDIEPDDINHVLERAREAADGLYHDIQAHIQAAPRTEMIKEGIRAVLVGPPNVGKSSLLNALVGRQAAIVSHHAGTTRDVIETALDVHGHKVVIQDGAGIRDVLDDDIEKEGISRILHAAKHAHILIVMSSFGMDHGFENLAELVDGAPCVLYVKNKIDLSADNAPLIECSGRQERLISCKTGHGMDSLINDMAQAVKQLTASPIAHGTTSMPPVLHRKRHLRHLHNAALALDRFRQMTALELAAEELRMAAREVERITGDIDVEDILDSIFTEFCIGK